MIANIFQYNIILSFFQLGVQTIWCNNPTDASTLHEGFFTTFSKFDDTTDKFDAYKVETIGDAYMIASGLPEKNNNRHVSEVAKLSLQLLTIASNFKCEHMKDTEIKLRIGIHSGKTVITGARAWTSTYPMT